MIQIRTFIIVVALGVLVAIVSTSTIAQAQPTGAPLVLLIEGDLWTLPAAGGGVAALTQNGHICCAQMSPDGMRIAYLTSSPITVDAIQRVGGIGGGVLPADIRYVDISTGADIPVAVQPPDASFFVEGVPDSAWLRSEPSWSPDGTRIAWAEIHYPSFAQDTNRLLVYDLTTGSTQIVLPHLPEPSGIPGPQGVMWGGEGLALIAYTFYQAGDGGISNYTAVQVYNLDGTLRSETRFQDDASESERAVDFYWMNQNGHDYLAVHFADGHWQLFDPVTGSPEALAGSPELYSPLESAGSLALSMSFDPEIDQVTQNRTWAVFDSSRQMVGYLDYHGSEITISPDGKSLAFLKDDQIIIWENGVQKPGINMSDRYVGALLWGPTAWRIAPAQPVTCPNALPSRLVVGGQAWVLPNTSPNNMRDMPTTAGNTVGQLPPGEPFAVLAGPECADGIAWWQVKYAGTIGWTAEGDGSEYWIEPINYDTLGL